MTLPYNWERLKDVPYRTVGPINWEAKYTCNKCEWSGFAESMRKVDFNSSREDWQNLAGSAGSYLHCPNCDNVVVETIGSMN